MANYGPSIDERIRQQAADERQAREEDTRRRVNGKDTSFPELLSIGEFMAKPWPEPVPILGPFSTAQLVHIAGPPGVGKTMFGIGMSLAMGGGRDLCHWRSHGQRMVLHIDGEMPPHALQARFRTQGARPGDRVIVLSAIELADRFDMGHVNLAEASWQAVIEHYIAQYGVSVLRVDNVMSTVHVPGLSMSSDEQWSTVSPWLRQLRGRGLTVIVDDHTNAAGQVFGTKTKTWNADLALLLSPPDGREASDGCEFVAKFDKTRGMHGDDVAPFRARFGAKNGETFGWSFETGNFAKVEAERLWLSQMPVSQIVECVSASKATVYRWAREFQATHGRQGKG